jgi:ankyrin repeat protein
LGVFSQLFESGESKAERLALAARAKAEREVANQLHEAIKNGDANVVKTILAETPSAIGCPPHPWQNALHVAAFYDRVDIAEIIVSHQPDIDIYNSDRQSPLHVAAYSGAAVMVEWLLLHGANVKFNDPDWKTPLHYLFIGPRSDWKNNVSGLSWDKKRWTSDAPLAFTVLLKHGADLNARSRSGTTPQDLAGRELLAQFQQLASKLLVTFYTKGVRSLKDPGYFECEKCYKKNSHQRADDARIGPVWICPSCAHQVVRRWGD